MRILIATYHTLPGYSGGWTTPLELLADEHEVMYAAARGKAGDYVLEDIPVSGLGSSMRPPFPHGLAGTLLRRFSELAFGALIKRCFRRHSADFILCLDMLSARQCISRGLPYALRIHSHPSTTPANEIRRLMESAIFATAGPSVSIDGMETLPHTENLNRFDYIEHSAAKRVVLVSSLDEVRNPLLFAEGVLMSSLKGTVVGDGPLRSSVEEVCRNSGGKLEYHEPVLRTDLPSLLNVFQIGVACHREVNSIYQMKVPEYQACGIFPLVMPWTHLALEAPDLTLTFRTPEELAMRIDCIAADWGATLEIRRRGRDYAMKNFHVKQAKDRFRNILRESGLI